MSSPGAHRYRILFSKCEAMRFTGHLDLHRAWERTFRRADLPLAYTQGFSPHPRLQLAAALPLGILGEAELLDAWLDQAIEPMDLLERLCAAAPPGIRISDAQPADPNEISLQQQVEAAVFLAIPGEPASAAELESRIDRLLSLPSIERERRGKRYDLRPLVLELVAFGPPEASLAVRMTLAARGGATGRPEELLDALELDASSARITRLRLILAQSPA